MARIVKAGLIQVANKIPTESTCEQHRNRLPLLSRIRVTQNRTVGRPHDRISALERLPRRQRTQLLHRHIVTRCVICNPRSETAVETAASVCERLA